MVVHVIFSLWVIYPQCDFSNALLQPYHDVLLRYDPLAGISSSGHAITTPFFFRNMRICWGAIQPENSLEVSTPGWSALAKKPGPAGNGG
jgi:hypothetical protein